MSIHEKKGSPTGTLCKLTVFDPEKPLYEKRHVCLYLRELAEEAEKAMETQEQQEI